MSLAFTPAEIAEHRADAESRMTSQVTIRRISGPAAQGLDGTVTPPWAEISTGVPFRLGGNYRGGSRSRTEGPDGAETEIAFRTGHLPHGFTDLRDGDFIDITDGENAGSVWVVEEATWQDQASARRVPIYQTQRPEEWDA